MAGQAVIPRGVRRAGYAIGRFAGPVFIFSHGVAFGLLLAVLIRDVP